MSDNNCILSEESKLLKNEGVIRKLPDFKRDLNQRLAKACYTPDINGIESRRGHLLFVYGTLKQGFSRHWMLKNYNAVFVANAITFNMYCLYYAPRMGFPVMMPSRNGDPVANVMGQLYIVPPKVIIMLDEMEKNGDMYHRYMVNTQVVSKPTNKDFQQFATTYAQCYVGSPKEWGPLVDNHQMLAMLPKEDKFLNWYQPKIYLP